MAYEWKSTNIHIWLTKVPKTFPSSTVYHKYHYCFNKLQHNNTKRNEISYTSYQRNKCNQHKTTTDTHDSKNLKKTLPVSIPKLIRKTELLSRATKQTLSRECFKRPPLYTHSELLFKFSRMEFKSPFFRLRK